MGLAAARSVPLKMLPFDNKNELLLVLDFDEGTTLERTDAAVRDFEAYLAGVPEVADYHQLCRRWPRPMDFNGLVRHYYLRQGRQCGGAAGQPGGQEEPPAAEPCHRPAACANELQAIADRHRARMKLVETPPGPAGALPVVVAEVYGRPEHRYEDILLGGRHGAGTLGGRAGRGRRRSTCGEAAQQKLIFVADKEKAAAERRQHAARSRRRCRPLLAGSTVGTVRSDDERNPLHDRAARCPSSSAPATADLANIHVKGAARQLVPLGRTGLVEKRRVDQTIYHKNLQRVAYVFAETAGRPPADVVVDVLGRHARTRSRAAAGERSSASATAGSVGRCRRGRSTSGPSSPTAAALPGACRRASRSISRAKGNGRSPWMCSATWGWPSARR